MHSRVAAVKAPRTHNRRRMTGSSGRRREGRESEPQRPNMSRHLFYSAMLLPLFVMMCCGSGGTAGVAGQSDDPQFEWKGITEGVTVESLGAPSLLKVGSDVFAVAEAQCKKNGDVSFTGVASQPLTTQTAKTPEELFSDALKKTQVLEEGASKDQKKGVDVSRPTTVVKGNDIYMLAGQYSSAAVGASGATQLGLLLVKGSVNSEDANNKKIDWKVTESSPQKLFEKQLDSWTRLIGSGGSGVKMKDDTLVFPVEGTKKADGTEVDVKTVSLIIHSSDNTNWKLPKGMSDGGCSDPSVVEWEDDKLMMMTACDGGRRRVYESGDKGESWTEALGTLSRVWGNNKNGGKEKAVRSGFFTANVGNDGNNKKVMLVTLPVYADNDKEKGKLHLWLTDNTHIVDIGPVSDDDDVAASSLLYNSGESGDKKEEELIALYEKKKDDGRPSPGMVSVLLTEQLQRVKDVLTTWKEVDKSVSQLCTSLIAEKDRSTDNACGPVKITAGLVGFLSGKFSDKTWRDEYLGVNATVNNNEGAEASAVTSTEKGVTFQGAWAEWPVGKQGENQLYHFANYNFTLVATVSIHNVPEGNTPIPLMGVKMNGDENNVLLGLSYDSGKKWHVLCGDKTTTKLSSTWETGTPQHVVILLKNGTQGSVYVDGQRVCGNGECALGNGESKEISHFYIGGDGVNAENKEGVSVTVTNVLLYNRPLDDTEIAAFNPNKANIPVQMDRSIEGNVIQPSPGGGRPEEQRQLLERSRADGVSAPTVSNAKTSSGGEGSATQLVSEESSDGSKNVGGASSPGSDAAVETGDRSTVQGDGSSPTLVGTPATADAYAPNAEAMGHDGTAVNPGASASSGADGETAEGTNGQEKEEIHAKNGEVKAAALSSSLGNLSQGNNTDACSVCGSGLLPLLLLLLLGLWGFAAL
ncbi:hypothetical protein ECC02_010999 [Trypanosoma cruzi]|uniref:Uncharacterized protein n=1 Tax=Trypanosoma cruzi TaxID=5693 RepID=A0A7J6XP70_TRYCR|nr:hypothetical protein ECC02_010999 [Trypanosoma cruzi]